ncbi:MAG TPA: divergent polysaccharide deacetylase family protein, partial [Rhodopila sp.]
MGGFLAGWRGLRRFWAGVLLLLLIGIGTLEILGPPPRPATVALAPSPAHSAASPADQAPLAQAPLAQAPSARAPAAQTPAAQAQPAVRAHSVAPPSSQPGRPGRDIPGPIADPDPGLLEPYSGDGRLRLPRIAVDGRTSMSTYAAAFDPTSMRPRVGMLVAGIGLSEAESMAAIKTLPGPVTLAISPYSREIGHLLDVARMSEHEYLLSVPMEPQ